MRKVATLLVVLLGLGPQILIGEEITLPVRTLDEFRAAAKELGKNPTLERIREVLGEPLEENLTPFAWSLTPWGHEWIYVNKTGPESHKYASILFKETEPEDPETKIGVLTYGGVFISDSDLDKQEIAKIPVTKVQGKVNRVLTRSETHFMAMVEFDGALIPEVVLTARRDATPKHLLNVFEFQEGQRFEFSFRGNPKVLTQIILTGGFQRFRFDEFKIIE